MSNGYSRKKIYYTILFVMSVFVSSVIFLAQLSTFAKFLAPVNLLSLISWGGEAGLFINSLMIGYVAYVVANTIFRIKIYKIFALHRGHSSASSLLFTAINLSRVCYPLCYNYLQITGMPTASFLDFFGEVNIKE
jgi:hypothetical protein